MIWIDDSSNQRFGGAKVQLRSPKGDTIKCAVRLQFPTTNNEVEYEAVLLGLDLAKAAGIMSVVIHYDSQVVVRHINLAPTEVDYVMKEFHKGVCENH